MNQRNLLRIYVFIFVTIFSKVSFATIERYTLPELVHKAPTIVKGTISIQNNKITINVEKTLKGQEHRRLIVLYQHWFEVPDPQFKNGENVLLFLYTPDPNKYILPFVNIPKPKKEEMYLFGLGDQAKWPRVYPEKPDRQHVYHHYPKLQDNASLNDIQEVVEKLLRIENTADLDEKVKLCTEYIRSSNPLLQFTALQYAIWGHLWSPPPGEPHGIIPNEVAERRINILRGLSDEVLALSLVDSNEPSIRAEAIRFLRYAYPGVAMPNLIRKITDDDSLVRSATRTVLGTMASELKIKGGFINYRYADPPEKLKSIQQQWNDWWQQEKQRWPIPEEAPSERHLIVEQLESAEQPEQPKSPLGSLAVYVLPTAAIGVSVLIFILWLTKQTFTRGK